MVSNTFGVYFNLMVFKENTERIKGMTEEQKQKYINVMEKKAFSYAENVLSDIKSFMSKDEYEETLKDFAQAFISGGNAAIKTVKEIIKGE